MFPWQPPGPIPVGYRFKAQSTSDATNQIPVEGAPDAEGDYRKLLGELEQYLTNGGQSRDLPPLFAKVGWGGEQLRGSKMKLHDVEQIVLVNELVKLYLFCMYFHVFCTPSMSVSSGIFFLQREFVERAEWSLQWLADNAGVTNRLRRVYVLEDLISALVVHSDSKVISPFVVEEMLKTSNYDHDTDTR